MTMPVFSLNYMNMLSNRSQVIYNKLWNAHIEKRATRLSLPSAALHDSLRREKTVHPNGRFGTPD